MFSPKPLSHLSQHFCHDKRTQNSVCHIAFAILCGLTLVYAAGCQSPAYKLVPKSKIVEPVALNHVKTDSALESTLLTVIVYHGPGSWKKEALWDEYVVELTNIGGNSLEITGFELIDFEATALTSGSEPWALEKASQVREKDFKKRMSNFQLGGLGAVFTVGAVAGGTAAYVIVGSTGSAVGGSAVVGACGVAIVVVAPTYYAYTLYKNHTNRKNVEAVFGERSMNYPLTLAPHKTQRGSLFFPIAPSPRELIIRYVLNGVKHDMHIELHSLNGIHFKSQPK